MSNNLLRPALIAVFGAMLSAPMFAHAAVITTTPVGFDVYDSVSDKLAAGATTNGPSTSSRTIGTTKVAKFDSNTGVLTGVTVNLTESKYKQTTTVTSAGTTSGNNNTTASASGTGSSTVQALVTGATTTASKTLTKIDDCTAKRKDACSDGPMSDTANYNFSVAPSALDQYAGSGTFDVQHTAALSAETKLNTFPSEATTTSAVNWTGNLSATYEYLLHAAQSFDGGSALTLSLDFGSVYLGDSASDQSFSIFNGVGNRVGLRLSGVTETGNGMFSTNLDTFSNIAAGSSQGFKASFLANQLGSFSTTYQLTLADLAPSTGHAASTLYSNYGLTLNLAGSVIARPAPVHNDVPEPASLMLLGMGAAAFGVSRKRKA